MTFLTFLSSSDRECLPNFPESFWREHFCRISSCAENTKQVVASFAVPFELIKTCLMHFQLHNLLVKCYFLTDNFLTIMMILYGASFPRIGQVTMGFSSSSQLSGQ